MLPAMEQPAPHHPIDEIPAVVAAVRAGFESGKTRALAWRKTQLRRLIEMMRREEDAIVNALADDLGKSRFEGWLAEVAVVAGEAEHALDHLDDWVKPEKVHTPLALQPARSRIYREPLGVALIIGAWNYPFQLIAAPLVGALAAGNAVVIKPSEVAAATSQMLARLLPKYLDPECVAVIEGGVPETTAVLEQRFDHILYTGNGQVGRIVMEAAARHLTPVTLELGGKSPCIVDGSADLDVAARRIVWGKYFNAGQTCVAPDYLLCKKEVEGPLVERLAATIEQFFGADPKASPDYARIINQRHFDRLRPLLDSGEIVCGGDLDAGDRYIAPTVLRGVSPDSPIMADEIFGPILPVLNVEGIDEAIAFINQRPKPLALYLFTGDRETEDRVLSRTTSGGGCINDTMAHLGVNELPFGGVGASGMGSYHGRAGFETFSHRRSVLHKSTLIDPRLRYPPYDEGKLKWVRRLV
jgi:aldehyde dehydrogenase (NAD+)